MSMAEATEARKAAIPQQSTSCSEASRNVQKSIRTLRFPSVTYTLHSSMAGRVAAASLSCTARCFTPTTAVRSSNCNETLFSRGVRAFGTSSSRPFQAPLSSKSPNRVRCGSDAVPVQGAYPYSLVTDAPNHKESMVQDFPPFHVQSTSTVASFTVAAWGAREAMTELAPKSAPSGQEIATFAGTSFLTSLHTSVLREHKSTQFAFILCFTCYLPTSVRVEGSGGGCVQNLISVLAKSKVDASGAWSWRTSGSQAWHRHPSATRRCCCAADCHLLRKFPFS